MMIDVNSVFVWNLLKACSTPNTCAMVREQKWRVCRIMQLVSRGSGMVQLRGVCVWDFGEREDILVEDNIARNINTIRWHMKTLIPFVKRAIPQKHTFFRSKLQLPFIIWSKMRPTCTPKNFKEAIIWLITKESFKRSLHVNDTTWSSINEETSSGKSITPESKRY
jgi:hypothetical protein